MSDQNAPRPNDCPGLRRDPAGFTLLELLVATSVLTLMLLFLFSVFDQSTKAWQAGERKVDAFREARAALFMIRRDLCGALVSNDSPMAYNQLSISIPFSGALAPGSTGSNLFFLTRLPLTAQGSDNASELCTVGYYIAWMRSAAGADQAANFSYNLVRYFIPSGKPNRQATDPPGTVEHLLAFITAGSNPTRLDILFPRVGSAVAPENEVLARNIVKFDLTPYVQNGSGLVPAIPSALTKTPRFIEITLEVLNNATAAKLGDSQTGWNPASSPMKKLIDENRQTFRSRLTFNP